MIGHRPHKPWRRISFPRRHKYGAKPATDMSGRRRFSSQLERDRYEELHLLELGGQIRGLVCQPRLFLLPGVAFRADFAYTETRNGTCWRDITEEVKGVETGRWRLVARLWPLFGPTVLRVVKRGRGGALVVTAEILPKPPVCRRCGEPWGVV